MYSDASDIRNIYLLTGTLWKMAEALKVSGKQLVCSICQRTFSEMTVSSCFHTFCLDCLGSEMSQNGMAHYFCPICKTRVNLPHEVMRSLKTEGYAIKNMMTKAQPATNQLCDICSDGLLATTRCMQCEENLCQNCTNVHLKMKASRYHRECVVPLRGQNDLKYSTDSEWSQSKNFCWRHRGEKIQFVCKKCDVILCLMCKLLEHENHVIKPISEEAKDARKNLNTLIHRSWSHFEQLHLKVNEIEAKQAKYPLELDKELNKIDYQASQIQSELEHEKRKAENELKSHYGNYLSECEREGEHFMKDYHECRVVNMEALQLLNNDDDVLVVEKAKFLGEKMERIDKDFTISSHATKGRPSKKFELGTIDTHLIHGMMGEVNDHSADRLILKNQFSHSYPHTPEYNSPFLLFDSRRETASSTSVASDTRDASKSLTTRTFTLPYDDGLGYVYGIAPSRNNQAWISLLDHRRLVLISWHGDIISIVDVGDVCEDVSSDMNDGCYVTCPHARVVKHVTSGGQIDNVISDLPGVPHGICLGQLSFKPSAVNEKHSELYVCFTEIHRVNSSVNDRRKGCVRVFTLNGEDLDQGFHIQAPVRIDVHSKTNTLCVSDHTNGCIVITDITGQFVKGLYTGEDDNELFKPLGVCFDSHGNIIIADWQNDCVRQIGQDGNQIRRLMCEVGGPQSVAVKNKTLWVGGKYGKIQVCSLD